MAGGVDVLSAEMARKAHIDAVQRDYICEPHLGALGTWVLCRWRFAVPLPPPLPRVPPYCPACPAARWLRWPLPPLAAHPCAAAAADAALPHCLPAEYRTVGGVAGPLVVVNTVKARWGSGGGLAGLAGPQRVPSLTARAPPSRS